MFAFVRRTYKFMVCRSNTSALSHSLPPLAASITGYAFAVLAVALSSSIPHTRLMLSRSRSAAVRGVVYLLGPVNIQDNTIYGTESDHPVHVTDLDGEYRAYVARDMVKAVGCA